MPSNTFLPETLLVIQYANDHSYLVSSEPYLIKLDQHIRDLKAFGLWDKFDLLYWMVGDGDMDFKTINIIDPDKYKGVLSGGLINTLQGIEGNGVDAYVDTNFNPSIGSNKYVETDAGRFMYVYKQSSIVSTVRRTLDGIAANSYRNYTTNIGNTQQQINSNANIDVAPTLSGLGYTSINRISNMDVLMYKEENQYTATAISDGVYSSNQIIFAKGSTFGDNGLSSYAMGASLTGQNAIDYRSIIITGINEDVDPPTILFDDILRTLTASHPLGISEILFSENDAPYEQYIAPIEVGRTSLPAGYYKFKTKAAVGRNESPVVSSPAIPRDTFLPETLLVIEFANNNSYLVSSERYLVNLDQHIRDLKAFGLWDKLDLLYWFVGDGDMDFKTINIINPSKYKGTSIGGLINTLEGIEGNAVDGYVDTNFNPSIGINKYTEINAGRYTYVYKASTFGTTVRSTVDGVTGNAFRNFLTNNNTVNQRINCSGSIDIAPSLGGNGYTSINRTSSTNVIMYKEENQFLASAVSDGLYNANQIIFAKSLNFGDNGLSCYGMGEALASQDQVNHRLSVINNNSTFSPFIADPPTVIGNAETRLLTATSPYESSAILYSINSGPFIQYEEPIYVGNDLVPEGIYKFKIKARLGRIESPVVDNPEIPENTYLPETLSIIAYANNHLYEVSSQFYLIKLDQYIRDLKTSGLWDKFDLMYWMVGDGDMDFKTINIVDPDSYKGTVTELFNTSRGIRGTGIGIIQTHFNPGMITSKYTQNNAGRGSYVYANDFVNVGTSIVDGIENNASFNMLKTRNGTDSRINSLNILYMECRPLQT